MAFKGDYLIFAELKYTELCNTTLKCLPLLKYEGVVLA